MPIPYTRDQFSQLCGLRTTLCWPDYGSWCRRCRWQRWCVAPTPWTLSAMSQASTAAQRAGMDHRRDRRPSAPTETQWSGWSSRVPSHPPGSLHSLYTRHSHAYQHQLWPQTPLAINRTNISHDALLLAANIQLNWTACSVVNNGLVITPSVNSWLRNIYTQICDTDWETVYIRDYTLACRMSEWML